MPLLETRGAASAQGFGFAQSAAPNYIEDVFQTWLYTGNGSTQTITNGIDLAGKGGLVWIKKRNAAQQHNIYDSARGWDAGGELITNTTDAAQDKGSGYFSVSGTGFSLPTAVYNTSSDTYVSWAFREQPKFFDVVTYTGNGTARTISHNLGSAPGCLIVKRTDSTGTWYVWHRAFVTAGSTDYIDLNQDQPKAVGGALPLWDNTVPTSTVFSLSSRPEVNSSGATYVAYLFAHNAGGFGLTGTDNVISCGSYTGNGTSGQLITLGYEPQFVLHRWYDGAEDWKINDVMRGMPVGGTDATLFPNKADAEVSGVERLDPSSTGFIATTNQNVNGRNYLYIAIRRGPMKVPTTGTSVFAPVAYTGNGANNRQITGGFVPDLFIPRVRNGAYGYNTWNVSRLQGGGQTMAFNAQFQEQAYDTGSFNRVQLAYVTGTSTNIANPDPDSMIGYLIRRAPSFYDTVCWTANGSSADINHNLTVRPQLILAKNRLNSSNWFVLVGGSGRFSINSTNAAGFNSGGADCLGSTTTTFNTSFLQDINSDQPIVNTQPYVAHLFASAPGVSRVSSYTGTGTTQVINCGFTGGARFVLIKATSTTGDWYVWDSARGIVAGNDPYVLFNSSVIETTNTDWVDTAASGFELSNAGGNLANSNGVSYIFLAIA